MNTQLWEQVSKALSEQPAKQPVANSSHVDSQPANGEKATSKQGMGTTKIKNRNAFNPNKTYSVAIIHKAQSKIG